MVSETSAVGFAACFLFLLQALAPTYAYIPAKATNDTSVATTNVSTLFLQWFGNGEDQHDVSYQLVGSGSNGISKGALVHFSEDVVTNDTTTTPWIALVQCDANATQASQEDDIFTLARDRGAVGALLFSEWSEACSINAEYADPANFDQVMDIFSTQSLSSWRTIEGTFDAINATEFGIYNAQRLNDSQNQIGADIDVGYVTSSGYIMATLAAYNATGDPNINVNGTSTENTDNGNNSSGSSRTTVAMIILYAITGCVSAMFCAVIITGAIRAIRHPERYRMTTADITGGQGYGGQGRGGALTRAILDTFPVVKWGRTPQDGEARPPKDIESGVDSKHDLEMLELDDRGSAVSKEGEEDVDHDPRTPPAHASESPLNNEHTAIATGAAPHDHSEHSGDEEAHDDATSFAIPAARPRPRIVTRDATHIQSQATSGPSRQVSTVDPVMPDAIGNETCPICIVDFEEGDDLRVLPCEGKHKFHQACVDPWLLELSTSCPICRHDFQTLMTMLSADEDTPLDPPSANFYRDSAPVIIPRSPMLASASLPHTPSHPHTPNRFSKYLKLARRRHRRNAAANANAAAPPVPTQPQRSTSRDSSAGGATTTDPLSIMPELAL